MVENRQMLGKRERTTYDTWATQKPCHSIKEKGRDLTEMGRSRKNGDRDEYAGMAPTTVKKYYHRNQTTTEKCCHGSKNENNKKGNMERLGITYFCPLSTRSFFPVLRTSCTTSFIAPLIRAFQKVGSSINHPVVSIEHVPKTEGGYRILNTQRTTLQHIRQCWGWYWLVATNSE